MQIDLPEELAVFVRDGTATANMIVFVNGQYMPPELGYCYGVTDERVALKFEGLGEVVERLSELSKKIPQLAAAASGILDGSMLQISIVVPKTGQWHYKDGEWTKR